MSQALVGAAERLSPALRENAPGTLLDPNGRPIRYESPAGHVAEGGRYTPDESVYQLTEEIRESAPVEQFLTAAREGRAALELHLIGEDEAGELIAESCAFSADAVAAAIDKSEDASPTLLHLTEAAHAHIRERNAERLREKGELLAEDDADYLYDNSGTGVSPQNPDENLPLGNGPFNQQLYLYDFWLMLSQSFWARTHDPVAKAALEIIVNFIIGRGFTVTAKDPLVQREWETFWKLNNGDKEIRTWLRDWFGDGENLTRFFRQYNGPPKIAMVEPSTIIDIACDPENLNDVQFYWQQYCTPYTIYPAPGKPSQRFIVRQIPADEIIHTKINASSWEKRGRSDLFSVLGWLKRLRDYYSAETMKAIVQAAFAWDITIKGSGVDVATVQSYADQSPPPNLLQQGQGWYHNDAVEVKPLQSDKVATSAGGIGIGDGILGIIAVGLNVAKDYLGVTSRGARATALVAETPAVKHFEARQRVVKHWLIDVAEKVMQIAQDEGRLPRYVWRSPDVAMLKEAITALRAGDILAALRVMRDILRGGRKVPLDLTIEVSFPDIVKGDRKQTLLDLEKAESNGWFSKRRAATQAAGAFDVTGYDYDDEQAEIEAEGRQVIARSGQQVPKGFPSADEPGWAPGTVADPDYEPSDDDGGKDSGADDNPAGNGAASIRRDNRERGARESFVRRAARKTISFIIGE